MSFPGNLHEKKIFKSKFIRIRVGDLVTVLSLGWNSSKELNSLLMTHLYLVGNFITKNDSIFLVRRQIPTKLDRIWSNTRQFEIFHLERSVKMINSSHPTYITLHSSKLSVVISGLWKIICFNSILSTKPKFLKVEREKEEKKVKKASHRSGHNDSSQNISKSLWMLLGKSEFNLSTNNNNFIN